MAKIYGLNDAVDFAAKNLITFNGSFARGAGQPLDKSAVWYPKDGVSGYDRAAAYAATDAAYVGQELAVIDVAYAEDGTTVVSTTVTFYGIQDIAGTLKELGKATIGDDKSIELLDGKLSLYGFDNAGAATFPRKSSDGKIDWVSIENVVEGDGNDKTEVAISESSKDILTLTKVTVDDTSTTTYTLGVQNIYTANEVDDQFATAANMQELVTAVADEFKDVRDEITTAVADLATEAYVDQAMSNVLSQRPTTDAVSSMINDAVADLATNERVNELIAKQNTVINSLPDFDDLQVLHTTVVGEINAAVDGLATEEYVGSAIGYALSQRPTEEEINKKISDAINDANHLTKKIITAVNGNDVTVGSGEEATTEQAVENVIYMLKHTDLNLNDMYDEYTLIEGTLTLIGSTSVDLENYATQQDVTDAKAEAITTAAADATDKVNKRLEILHDNTSGANISSIETHGKYYDSSQKIQSGAFDSKANGPFSTAMGGGTQTGDREHPENTLSNDKYVIVNGAIMSLNSSEAAFAHAEGNTTTAVGQASHTEGKLTYAKGDASHAEGYSTYAYARYGHTEGKQTRAGYSLDEWISFINESINGDVTTHSKYSKDVFNKQFNFAQISHSWKYWIADPSDSGSVGIHKDIKTNCEAFKTIVKDCSSNKDSIPYNRFYEILRPMGAHAEGSGSIAEGTGAHAEGCEDGQGNPTRAIGNGAHAEGSGTQALIQRAHAEGYMTRAEGDSSHAEGFKSIASANHAHAEGRETKAIGKRSHAEGSYSEAIGCVSHSQGYNTRAYGLASMSAGTDTEAGISLDQWLDFIREDSGNDTLIAEDFDYTQTLEDCFHWMYQDGWESFEEWDTDSSSQEHIEAINNIYNFSYENGKDKRKQLYDLARTEATSAFGIGTKAKQPGQFVIGKYNTNDENALFIIGKGTSGDDRNNLVTAGIDADGDYLKVGQDKVVTFGMTLILNGGNFASNNE